jgi:capsular exopolysaccharide synthesis family protein
VVRSQYETEVRRAKEPRGLSRCLVTVLAPHSIESEAYRTLRTNVLHALTDGTSPRMLVITSPGHKESKSTVCANLGVALAQADKNTLIVDCDLRQPKMHKIFGLQASEGIVDVLAERSPMREVCQEPLPNLKVLAAGTSPPDPAKLIESQRLSRFFDEVREEFDYVLVDSSPAGLVSDPAVLAAQGDGVLLVLNAQKTRKEDVRRTVRNLTAVGATVLGTVMDNVKGSQKSSY